MDLPKLESRARQCSLSSRDDAFETVLPEEANSAFLHKDLDALASFYGSERGTQFRSLSCPEVTTVLSGDDNFLFEFIPEGKYRIVMGAMSGKTQLMKYKADTEDKR